MSVIDILKPHNLEAFEEINKMLESGKKKIAVPRATGSGKTFLMGALAEKYSSDKKIVLEPTKPLLDSIKDKFDEFGIENTDFITYQKLIRMSDEDIAEMDYKLIFLDECHHGTAPKWGQKIRHLMETHSDSIICGTSATTVRNDGVNVVEGLFENNSVEEFPLSMAIARKVLPCPHYITAIYRLDDEFEKLKKRIEASTNTKEEKREFYEKMKIMQSHFEKSYGIPTILNKYIKVKNGRYLVFCKDKKHLDSMRDIVIDWFKTAGIKDIHSYAVFSDYPDKEKDYKEFCADISNSAKILFSINMLNEGLHIKDISGVLMLRTTQSHLIYLQQLGRLVDADNIDKYLLVFDFVNNFSRVNDGIGLLREIKNAVAKEKESDPDFDDDGFEDIDTFFVLEQVVEIQEMFREIEGRLKGDWDNGLKHFDKYVREHNGDVLVPKGYVDDEDFPLGNWVNCKRWEYKNKILLPERINELNKREFVWEVYKYNFQNNIKSIAKYYKENKKYPSMYSNKKEINRLGQFMNSEKVKMRKNSYPEWKMKIVKEYLPEFSCEYYSDKVFEQFIYYATLYKEKYGHVCINRTDVINNYQIGYALKRMKNNYKNNKLNDNQIKELGDLGISFEDKFQRNFDLNMEIVKRAIKDGVVINSTNQKYKNKNLYNWVKVYVKKKYKNNKLTKDEIAIIEKLFKIPIYKIFNNGSKYIRVFDVKENREIGIYNSYKKVMKIINGKFDSEMSKYNIYDRLSNKVNNPYKGRFMFYYATDEEVKKYLEENKAN